METKQTKREYSDEKIKERKRAKKNRDIHKEEFRQLKEIKNQYDFLRKEYENLISFKNQKEEMEKQFGSLRKQNIVLEKRLEEMEMAIEQYKNWIIDLKNVRIKLEQRNMELEQRHMKLDSEIVNLMEILQLGIEKDVKQQIVNNTLDLISKLPPRSPIRRPLLSFFLQGLSEEQAQNIYGISDRTYKRVLDEDGSILVELKYKPDVTRKRISDSQLIEAKEILDDLIPVQSGRDFRTQEMTNKGLYELYENSIEGKPVSKSYFLYQILTKEKIHHSKKMKFCPLCEKYEDQKADEEVMKHVQLFPIQRRKYMKDKEVIISGKDSTTVLVVQDFSQLELDSSFVQDLILCKYSYNKDKEDKLDREYRHFVGQIGDKNDISFVVGAWLALFKSNWFNGAKVVKIWSDGGPKHFKISANMKFFLAIQQSIPTVKWIYNFFASYHGCSVCDGVAAQAKGTINRTMRDTQIAIREVPKAIEIIAKLGGHVASTVVIPSNDFSSQTFHGIKSYHKFEVNTTKNYIYAFTTSEDSKYSKRFHPQEIEDLLGLLE